MSNINALSEALPLRFDRSAHWRREPDTLARALDHESARIVITWRSKSLVRTGEIPIPVHLPRHAIEVLGRTNEELWFLGVDDNRNPAFALDLSGNDEPDLDALQAATTESPNAATSAPLEFADLRQLASLLPERDGNLIAYARALATWHFNHQHCGRCGAATKVHSAGHVRRCSQCNHESFPRTDPAVIMLVHDGADHCLLGRQASWPEGVYSTLAGFVEPGESLEMAVAREVFEESGVVVESATYQSSQPWPFPASIMLGFQAKARPGEASALDDELEDARWFELDELHMLLRQREVRLPPPMSIARRLIDRWLEERRALRPTL